MYIVLDGMPELPSVIIEVVERDGLRFITFCSDSITEPIAKWIDWFKLDSLSK